MITTILFDLDGTLCDCAELHYISLNKALQEISGFIINHEEHLLQFNGLPTNKKLEMLISDNRINKNDKDRIWKAKQSYTKDTIQETLLPIDEKIQMHQYLKLHNYNIACVTNSIYETAILILEATGQLEYIDWIIANDKIKNPKPHPEGFIRAMIHFGTMPEETLIVEDSPVGLQAAQASGANVWNINNCSELNLENIIEKLHNYT